MCTHAFPVLPSCLLKMEWGRRGWEDFTEKPQNMSLEAEAGKEVKSILPVFERNSIQNLFLKWKRPLWHHLFFKVISTTVDVIHFVYLDRSFNFPLLYISRERVNCLWEWRIYDRSYRDVKLLRNGKTDRMSTLSPILRASIRGSVSLSLFLFITIFHVEDILGVAAQLTVICTFWE